MCVFVMHIFTVGLVVSVMHVFTTDSFVSSHNGEGEADCGSSTSSVDDGDDEDDDGGDDEDDDGGGDSPPPTSSTGECSDDGHALMITRCLRRRRLWLK